MLKKNKALDKIYINDLTIKCIIGLLKKERRKKQKINVNIILYCALAEACKSDKINDTVDYIAIEKNIINLINNSSFFLIESLAESIAKECLKNKKVKQVEVDVKKFKISKFFKSSAVKLLRQQKKGIFL